MNDLARFVALVTAAVLSACGGSLPMVPPVEFRLNSPAPPPPPTTVTDNHQETHPTVQILNTVNYSYAPVSYSYALPVTEPPPRNVAPAEPASHASPISAAAARVVAPVLHDIAARELPGMQPLGTPFAAQFREGQTLEMPLWIEPGKCYSILGTSAGIQDLDIELGPAPIHGSEPSVSPTAVLGSRKAGCIHHTYSGSIPTKIIVRAAKGSGLAAAQVYVQ